MRSVTWWLCLAVAAAGLMLFGNGAAVFAEEQGESKMEEQHEQQPPPLPQLGPRHIPVMRVVPTPAVEATFWRGLRLLKCVGWTLFTCHILLAVWIFLDIRKRGEGNGIFIALALLAGFPAAVVYSLVRLGDLKKG